MNALPPLHTLSSEQKDMLILALWEENQVLKSYVAKLEKRITELEEEVQDLKNKLGSNSQNSHKPPSSDGLKKIMPIREKSSRKSGGQFGHKGHTLKLSDKPDKIIEYQINACPHCKADITDIAYVNYKRGQVFDIPELKMEVVEHRVFEKICPCCGKACVSSLPEGVTLGHQYGARLRSFLIYLHHYHFVASNRIREFVADMFGHTISEDMVFKSEEEVYLKLCPFEREVKEQLKEQYIAHADETSLRVNAKNSWLHVLSTDSLTCLFVHQKRGKKAMDDMGILPFFEGILIHDHWKAYFQYKCRHALCNAHHLRELKAISEGTTHKWALKMSELLKEIKRAKDRNLLKTITSFEARYDCILDLGYKEACQVHETGPPLKKSHPKEICLLDRLKSRKKEVLAFMYEKDVPFTNNLAERDIRMMKVKMKVSGCFRTPLGAQIFCRIRGYISTLKKRGITAFQALLNALNGCVCPSFS